MVVEPESQALAAFLRESELIASELVLTEVTRAANRREGVAASAVQAVLDRVTLVPMDGVVLRSAAIALPRELRTLDAIHLSTALLLRPSLTGLLCYDSRLAEAAAGIGLPVTAPA